MGIAIVFMQIVCAVLTLAFTLGAEEARAAGDRERAGKRVAVAAALIFAVGALGWTQ